MVKNKLFYGGIQMRKIAFYIVILLALPALAATQPISGSIITKKPKVCQFRAGIELTQKRQNLINPFASVGFRLSKTSKVSLSICDAYGKEIMTLLNEELSKGYHSVRHYALFDNGRTYYYIITAEAGTRKTTSKVQILL
jgi:hypothetical protein